MRYFLALLLIAPVYGAVDGVVINGATDKPQANSTVTLFQTTQQGPQDLGSVKTDAQGHFVFTQNVQAGQGGGPLLLQAVFDGVQYNKTLPPGFPTSNVSIPVFPASKNPGHAKIDQHFLVLEPNPNGTMQVTEGYIFSNAGKTTWNDPDRGTLQFALPAQAGDKVELNVTAPGGLPIRRAPDPAGKPHEFKVDFPIKPGETRMEMSWNMPFNTPGVFEDQILSKTDNLRVVAPKGVEFKGEGLQLLGQEPTSQASIYSVKGPDIKFAVQGTGLFNQPDDSGGGQGNGQSLSENLPKLYGLLSANSSFGQAIGAVRWVLATVFGMLALGFVLLYRKGDPVANRKESDQSTKAASHARGRG